MSDKLTALAFICATALAMSGMFFFATYKKEKLEIKNKLPLTFIALKDNELVGTIGLWRSDLMSRQDLFPWLSALFVKENFRGKRIGQKLQDFLVEYCKKRILNMKKILINLLTIIIIAIIIWSIHYKINHPSIYIDKNKVHYIEYTYEFKDSEMGNFDITKKLSKSDIDSIVDSITDHGTLKPGKTTSKRYNILEHVSISFLNDRTYDIYRQKKGVFTIVYTIDPTSNDPKKTRYTDIRSQLLESYFYKFKAISKHLKPTATWELSKYLKKH